MSNIVNTELTEIIVTEQELEEAAKFIRGKLSSSRRDAIEAAVKLVEYKEKLPHGHFTEWVLTAFNFSYSTANNLMSLARNLDRLENTENLSQSALYTLVAASVPEEALEIAKEVSKKQDKPVSRKQAKEIIQSLTPAVDLVSESGFGVIPHGWLVPFEGMLGKCIKADWGKVEIEFPNDVLVETLLSQVWNRPAIAGNQVIVQLRSARKMGATKEQKEIFNRYNGLKGKVEKIGVKDCSVTVKFDFVEDAAIVFWDEIRLLDEPAVDASVFNPGDRIRRKSGTGFVWHGAGGEVTEFAYVSAVKFSAKFGDKPLLEVSRNPDLLVEGFVDPNDIDFAPEPEIVETVESVDAIAPELKPVAIKLNPITFEDKLTQVCEKVSADPVLIEFPSSQEREDFLGLLCLADSPLEGFVLLRIDVVPPDELVEFVGKANAIAFIQDRGLILNLLYFGATPEKFHQACKDILPECPVFINASEVQECLDF